MLCDSSGSVFLAMHCVELFLMFLCSSRFVMLKRHKVDMSLVGCSLVLLVFGHFYALVEVGDKRLTQMACALPTLRLLTFLAVPKKFLRATWLGIRAASSLVPLIIFSLYVFSVLGVELYGCIDGLQFGNNPDVPHASFDTIEYAMVTMFTLYIGENIDPIKYHMLNATRNHQYGASSLGVQMFFVAFQLWSLVLSALFIGAILYYFEVRVRQLTERSQLMPGHGGHGDPRAGPAHAQPFAGGGRSTSASFAHSPVSVKVGAGAAPPSEPPKPPTTGADGGLAAAAAEGATEGTEHREQSAIRRSGGFACAPGAGGSQGAEWPAAAPSETASMPSGHPSMPPPAVRVPSGGGAGGGGGAGPATSGSPTGELPTSAGGALKAAAHPKQPRPSCTPNMRGFTRQAVLGNDYNTTSVTEAEVSTSESTSTEAAPSLPIPRLANSHLSRARPCLPRARPPLPSTCTPSLAFPVHALPCLPGPAHVCALRLRTPSIHTHIHTDARLHVRGHAPTCRRGASEGRGRGAPEGQDTPALVLRHRP